ncbi:MAG: hypothetical protein IT350_17805 [Deltaproteobacteria bacterium]|nr:hypothetical protein [Deltaproteobacteria bacterium]
MLFRYLLPSLLQLAAILIAPPLVASAVLALRGTAGDARTAWIVCAALIGLAQIALVLDKGFPFLFGNIYMMASMDPKWFFGVPIGLALDGLWLWRSVVIATRWSAKWRGKSGRAAEA